MLQHGASNSKFLEEPRELKQLLRKIKTKYLQIQTSNLKNCPKHSHHTSHTYFGAVFLGN